MSEYHEVKEAVHQASHIVAHIRAHQAIHEVGDLFHCTGAVAAILAAAPVLVAAVVISRIVSEELKKE